MMMMMMMMTMIMVSGIEADIKQLKIQIIDNKYNIEIYFIKYIFNKIEIDRSFLKSLCKIYI
jgi:hypothetical protein